jgi:hypothetical protein
MATLTEVKEALAAQKVTVDMLAVKFDEVIALVQMLQSANAATVSDLDALRADIDANTVTLTDVVAKEDTLLS